MGGSNEKPLGFAHFHDAVLIDGIIHREHLGCDDHFHLFLHQLPQARFDILVGQLPGIPEHMLRLQGLASQLDMVNARIPLHLDGLQSVFRHGEDADLADVPLQQGIRRLGRSVGDENNLLGVRLDLPNQMLQALHHPFSHAVFMVMGGRNFDRPDDFQGVGIDGDGIGKGPSHINPDANATAHGITPSIHQSNSGNMKMVRTVPIKPNSQA